MRHRTPGGMPRPPAPPLPLPLLPRRAALMLPAAGLLGGCSLFDNWFGESKPPLPGKRFAVMAPRSELQVPKGKPPQIVLPAPVVNAAWPQAGGNPAHLMGHLAAGDRLDRAWRGDIGAGGGYRQKITAQPVVGGGLVYAMDADAVVSAFRLADGDRAWRVSTEADDNRSTNVGGGIGLEGNALYAATGRAELLRIDARNGTIVWRKPLPAPARSAPTIAEGRLFVTTIEDELVALAADDGRRLWTYRAATPTTGVLGQPAPAVSEGLVVAGFGSGELACLRVATGTPAWSDSLASSRGRTSLADLSAIRGLPVIQQGQVFAISLGGQLVGFDLRSGRRLWELNVAGGTTPWLTGDWMFVILGDQRITAIAAADGRPAWVTDLPRFEDPENEKDPIFWLGPVLVGDRLVSIGTNAQAIAVSPYTGAILGHQELSGKASVAPVVVQRTLLVVSDDGTLLAMR